MARRCTSGNYLKADPEIDIGGTGSAFIKFRPIGWGSGESVRRIIFDISVASPQAIFQFMRYSDNQVYWGFEFGAGNSRAQLSDVGLFSDGVWANWLLTWFPSGGIHIYHNGDDVIGTVSFTINGMTGGILGIGTVASTAGAGADTFPANGDVAEFALWNRILNAGEIADLGDNTSGPGCMSSGLTHWVRLLGDASPEPADVGPSLVLVGSPSQQTHPTVDNCEPLTVVPSSISLTLTLPDIAVEFPLPAIIDVSAITLMAVIPTPGIHYVMAKGLTLTISDRLAEG